MGLGVALWVTIRAPLRDLGFRGYGFRGCLMGYYKGSFEGFRV